MKEENRAPWMGWRDRMDARPEENRAPWMAWRDRMDARPEENRAPWMAWRDRMDARPEENRAPWMAWRDRMDARLIIVASTNPGKIREVRLALGDLQGWAVEPLPPGIHGIEETGGSFIENAIQKAEHYSRFVEGLTLGDDSGLCVHALHDAPGLHSARYGPTPEARNQRVLSELEAIGAADRNATFICAFALARAGTVVWKTEARLAGRIAHEPAGAFGFGYDPIFDVPELGKTLAELPPEEKNRTSARGRALVELRRFLAGV